MANKFDRRAMLACSAAGSAALAGLFSATNDLMGGQQTPLPSKRVRRVVSGHNAEGKSYIVSDEMAEAANLWTTSPDQPLGSTPPGEARQLTHATGDTGFHLSMIQPKEPRPNLENRIGFHRTPGIAYCYILDGEIVYLVDMQETRVRAGDLVVERNTMHSWRNEGTVPVGMLVLVVNAIA